MLPQVFVFDKTEVLIPSIPVTVVVRYHVHIILKDEAIYKAQSICLKQYYQELYRTGSSCDICDRGFSIIGWAFTILIFLHLPVPAPQDGNQPWQSFSISRESAHKKSNQKREVREDGLSGEKEISSIIFENTTLQFC